MLCIVNTEIGCNIIKIADMFIMFNVVNIPLVPKTISITEEVYNSLVSLKRGKQTFSDVIKEMYNELYGTVDEEEEDSPRL